MRSFSDEALRATAGLRTIQSSATSTPGARALGEAGIFPKPFNVVHGKGLEPLRLAAAEPKSAASANFATRARLISFRISPATP